MDCFEAEGGSPRSPATKRPLKQRGLLRRQICQAIGLASLALIFFVLARGSLLTAEHDVHYASDEFHPNQEQEQPRMDTATFVAVHPTTPASASSWKPRPTKQRILPYLEPDFEPDTSIPVSTWQRLPVRGAFYMVVRNQNLQEARSAIRSIEDRFNKGARYPWVLLNNQDFTHHFRKYITKATSAPVFFGKIDLESWDYPSWIDVSVAEENMLNMWGGNVYKGNSLSYRQLLRYQAGLFVHHPLFSNVDYVWRVEPDSHYTCDMSDDPFKQMMQHNKTLGFAISMHESPGTINNLWEDTLEFMDTHEEYIRPVNETIMPWILDENDDYNLCHIWTNFEIVKTSFLKSKGYQSYFEFLDRRGGFFYERWGDAPIRTLAAAMFLPRDQLMYFDRIGYEHSVASHCPVNAEYMQKCSCDVTENFDFNSNSCTVDLLKYIDEAALHDLASFAESQMVD